MRYLAILLTLTVAAPLLLAQDMPLFQSPAGKPGFVRKDAAGGLFQRNGAEFHAGVSGAFRSALRIEPSTATAISSGEKGGGSSLITDTPGLP